MTDEGPVSYQLGMENNRDRSKRTLSLTQRGYF